MKIIKGISLSIIALFAVIAMSCNGTTEDLTSESCQVCHTNQMKADVEFQFAQSVHSAGLVAVDYAGGRADCARCHSHEGFVAFAGGQDAQDISAPSPWECKTCHDLHMTFDSTDYALRLAEPIHPIYDETVTIDLKNGNLCANCHQSRRAEPNMDIPGTTYTITSTHYGPHHGAQANNVYGGGFAEIAGDIPYPAAESHAHFDVSCTGCHMGTYTDGDGGHTYNPNVENCLECHEGATDFNIGGVQTEVEGLLTDLADALLAKGVLEEDADGVLEPVVGTYPMVQAQAFFNWVGLEEDRSMGVHNPPYIKALLKNSIAALN
jgi:hypothetical protein